MELHFISTPPGASRPAWIIFQVKNSDALRKRTVTTSVVTMGTWLLCMFLNVIWTGLVPVYVSLPFGIAGCAGFYLIAMIDEARRAEAAEQHEQADDAG